MNNRANIANAVDTNIADEESASSNERSTREEDEADVVLPPPPAPDQSARRMSIFELLVGLAGIVGLSVSIIGVYLDHFSSSPTPTAPPTLRVAPSISLMPSLDPLSVPSLHPTGAPTDSPSKPPITPSNQFFFYGPKNIVRTAVGAPDGEIFSTPTDFRLSFTIEPLGTISEFGNIIHFTTGDRWNKAPAIFFSKDSTELNIQISTDSFPDPRPTHQSIYLELNKRHDVVLLVVGSTSTLSIDDTPVVKSITARSQYPKLDVYIGSPWYEPVNAIISDVQFFPATNSLRSFNEGPLMSGLEN